ncbi:MAG TPA: Ku protein [Acidobacteriaceae bacterium]|jgi:DNA end-binding protein Ku|nr:Ku protein [Acidobacteriaceae bacterium]
MPARPTWSGSIQISLVSIEVRIYPASNPPRQVEFHMIDRRNHQRVHHRNVDESGEVEKADLVKGFEYARNKYIEIDPDELKSLRLPTADTLQIRQFAKEEEIRPLLYDRPYFVAPRNNAQAKALAIMRRALDETDTYGIGEVAFSGREHLVAIGASPDSKQKGLMLYVLRYAEELRDAKAVVGSISEPLVTGRELALAKQLIQGSTSRFDLGAYKDDYEAEVVKLVKAKRKGKPLPEAEPERPRTKVVNIMDALRKSLAEQSSKGKKPASRRKAA